jgi:DNA-binding CsgD family transcriptional regulator
MMDKLVFVYYIFCYSTGLLGFAASLLSSFWRTGTIGALRDRRFTFLSLSFSAIVIPFSVSAYLTSLGGESFTAAIILSAVGMAGEAGLVLALPHFIGGFSDPPKMLGKRKIWILLAGLAAVSGIMFFIFIRDRYIRIIGNTIYFAIVAAMLDSIFSGRIAIKTLEKNLSCIASGSRTEEEILRWIRILRFAIGSSLALLPFMFVVDFFPQFFTVKIPGFPMFFKFFPLLYAIIHATYAWESLKPVFMKTGFDQNADISRSPRILERLADQYGLSPRETEVTALLADGATYKEISWRLRISMGTVQSHILSIYQKLKVNCKEDLMRLARGER